MMRRMSLKMKYGVYNESGKKQIGSVYSKMQRYVSHL